MKTNKFLIFALLLGSFALNAEVAYYKNTGNLLKPNWVKLTEEEFHNDKAVHSWTDEGCSRVYNPYINGMMCNGCRDSVYAVCIFS